MALLLCLLAVWQRRIDRAASERVVGEIREATDRGAHRPVGQYPQIEPLLCFGCTSCIRACPEEGVLGLVDGIAHVIRASRCIGHERCVPACPVGAVTVGLGNLDDRPDVPRLTDDYETTVPGVFVAGELGGIALIRHAIAQGAATIDTIAAQPRDPLPDGAVDVLIVGGGPAGLAALLRAIECGVAYRTIDQGSVGGTIGKYPRGKLVMTQPATLPLYGPLNRHEYRKEELIALWEELIETHAVRIDHGVKLTSVARDGATLLAATSAGPIRCRFLVLALGRRGTPRKLGVPGEEREKVLYQLLDAASYRHRHLLVVGGGDSAIEAATALSDQPGNQVTLSYRRPHFFRIKPRNEERILAYSENGRLDLALGTNVREIGADEVVLTDACGVSERVRNDGVFVFAGGDPPFPLLKAAGVEFWGGGA